MHIFASLERFSIDRGNLILITARPDLNDQQTTRDRVWNTIVRGDHQVNRNNTYSVRWLRETSPQQNQIIGAVTAKAARSEADVDQTLAVNFNSVLSNTKVNTLRLTWTRENVTFGNACYNANGRDLSKCPPTLAFQSLHRSAGQHRPVPHQRRHPARRDARLVPARQARRSRSADRRAVRVLGRLQPQRRQPERHVLLRPEQQPVQRRRIRGRIRTASASASAGPASSTRRPTTSRRSSRTSGA